MRKLSIAVLLLSCAAAHAQSADFSAAASLKVWSAEWSTFTYLTQNGLNEPVPGETRNGVLLIPSVVARWGSFLASASGVRKGYGGGQSRREWDANLGFQPLPSLAVWVGYKKVGLYNDYRYEPKGPTASVSVSAPLDGAWSLYGSVGFGRLKTPAPDPSNSSIVSYAPGPYRITEIGCGYGLASEGIARGLTLTLGYRTQVVGSRGIKDDGTGSFNDVSQGITLGLVATF